MSIAFKEFERMDIRIGKVINSERIEGRKKLFSIINRPSHPNRYDKMDFIKNSSNHKKKECIIGFIKL